MTHFIFDIQKSGAIDNTLQVLELPTFRTFFNHDSMRNLRNERLFVCWKSFVVFFSYHLEGFNILRRSYANDSPIYRPFIARFVFHTAARIYSLWLYAVLWLLVFFKITLPLIQFFHIMKILGLVVLVVYWSLPLINDQIKT